MLGIFGACADLQGRHPVPEVSMHAALSMWIG